MLIKVELIVHKKVTQFLKFTDQKSDFELNIRMHWKALLYHKQFRP